MGLELDSQLTQCHFTDMSDSDVLSPAERQRAATRRAILDAAVVLGRVGTADGADVLTRVLDDREPRVREAADGAARLARR